jgi:hypothetical protein
VAFVYLAAAFALVVWGTCAVCSSALAAGATVLGASCCPAWVAAEGSHSTTLRARTIIPSVCAINHTFQGLLLYPVMSAAASFTRAPAAARFAPLPVRRNAPRATTVKAAAHSLSARRGVVELARAVPLATARVVRSVGRERQLRVVSVDDPDNPDMDNEPIMAGRPTALWRVLSCLPYLVPLMGSLAFGTEMYDSHPLTSILILVFQPLLQVRIRPSLTRLPSAAPPRHAAAGGPCVLSVPRCAPVRGTEAPCRRGPAAWSNSLRRGQMPAVTVGVPRPSPAETLHTIVLHAGPHASQLSGHPFCADPSYPSS